MKSSYLLKCIFLISMSNVFSIHLDTLAIRKPKAKSINLKAKSKSKSISVSKVIPPPVASNNVSKLCFEGCNVPFGGITGVFNNVWAHSNCKKCL